MRQFVISKSITPRAYGSLDKYLREINKIQLIDAAEEAALAQKIREGDREALERLTETNLRFVVSVAKQYQNKGMPLCDLINEGNLGLITAAKRYDETKGFKFISFAVWWIRQAIQTAIAEHTRIVRLPYNQLGMLSKIYKALSRLEQVHGRKPSAEELADYLGIPAERVRDLIGKSGHDVSLDAPYTADGDRTLLDVLHDGEVKTDHIVMYDSLTKEIACSLSILNKRERELLLLYFGLSSLPPLSLEDIAGRFNLSREHVYRLKEKALLKLRSCSHAPVLISYLS